MEIIEVKGLQKSYGDLVAIKGIDFYVEKGKLFAFLGPNGAGKSTTIDIICTVLGIDKGSIIIDGLSVGKDDSKIREIIGAVFQDGVLDKRLSVYQNLKIRGSFYSLKGEELEKKIIEVANETGIIDFLKRPYGKLSGGQRRRADIARALLNTPKVLFLDEPTTGLDPQTRRSVWDTIKKLQIEKDVTVFLTTHYMEEANEADFVIVIDDGMIAAKGTPAELKEKYSKDSLLMTEKKKGTLNKILKEASINYEMIGKTYKIYLDSTLEALPIIEKCKNYISGFEVMTGTMDDVFLGITGKEIRE